MLDILAKSKCLSISNVSLKRYVLLSLRHCGKFQSRSDRVSQDKTQRRLAEPCLILKRKIPLNSRSMKVM